jgi:NAD(P)-dependent dehydrogenase (short-subunit alcohol dehydrogenase family)
MRTIAVTGSASGIGAATAELLTSQGHRVIGVDIKDADVVADLGTAEGREVAVEGVTAAAGGSLDGLITCAGLAGLPGRSGALLVSVNYFGTVVLLEGLRPLLAKGEDAAATVISSNSITCQPGWPVAVADACLTGDEERARKIGEEAGSMNVYPATKSALVRYIRRHGVSSQWIGSGIRINAVAPGMIETPLVAEGRAHPDVGPLLDQFPIPVGRPGRPEEIAAFLAFLTSPAASFFCGSVLFADGGTDALLRPDGWPDPREIPSA